MIAPLILGETASSMGKRNGQTRESGQALVEAALTMPMAIFLILGTIQLFLMLQARIMAEYAVVQAVRQGSVRYAACEPMVHTAVSLVLPTFRRTDDGETLGAAFKDVFNGGMDFRFKPGADFGHDGQIVWLYPSLSQGIRGNEEQVFDDLSQAADRPVLSAQMVFWFPLKIPFANWIIARMALAENGIRDYTAANPLMFTRKNANWTDGGGAHALAADEQRAEWSMRVSASKYTVPIVVNAAMPMMSPPRSNAARCF